MREQIISKIRILTEERDEINTDEINQELIELCQVRDNMNERKEKINQEIEDLEKLLKTMDSL